MSHLDFLMGLDTEKEFLIVPLRDPSVFESEHFSIQWIDEEAGIQGVFGLLPGASVRIPVLLLFSRGKNWTMKRVWKWLHGHPQFSPDRRLQEGRRLRKKPPTLKAARRPVKERRKQPPAPVINLINNPNIPNCPNVLKGDTVFLADSWFGLFGPTQEWVPRAFVEDARRERGR